MAVAVVTRLTTARCGPRGPVTSLHRDDEEGRSRHATSLTHPKDHTEAEKRAESEVRAVLSFYRYLKLWEGNQTQSLPLLPEITGKFTTFGQGKVGIIVELSNVRGSTVLEVLQ